MKYRHIHYLDFEPGIEENVVLDAAIKLAEKGGEPNFFLKAASFLCKHTQADYVAIGLLSKDKLHVSTCIMLYNRIVQDNFTYSLKGTPCADVVTQKFCYYPFGAKEYFPDDKLLRKMNIESYLGTLLLSPESEAIGIVELLSIKQIENPALAEHLILVLSPVLETELLKHQAKN
ncbi:hypothetical protein [Pontibacter sp. H249]|uniref:hypothetical protein n=1 Tax=Pontibacter sp. H249 TaxID=3133420 RepID=UPI0030C0B1D9